jgi:putative ABC transport system substrate-binding protein
MPPLSRRDVLAGLLLATTARPAAAQVQRRIAIVHSGVPASQLTESARGTFWIREFFVTLRRLGYEEGKNLIVERYSAEGQRERFLPLAQEVVRRNPEVIVSNLTDQVAVLMQVTTTIPIVGIVGEPTRSGLITNLARPSGNLTGVSSDLGVDLVVKGLQFLKEAVPAASRIGYLAQAGGRDASNEQSLGPAAQQLGVAMFGLNPADITEPQLRAVFADASKLRLDALMIGWEGTLLPHRVLIVELAAAHRLPAFYPYRDYVELGGLLAYGPDLDELGQRMADDVVRILSGTKAGDIPFWRPTRLQLTVNLSTAKTLGLTFPPALMGRADRIVE